MINKLLHPHLGAFWQGKSREDQDYTTGYSCKLYCISWGQDYTTGHGYKLYCISQDQDYKLYRISEDQDYTIYLRR